MFALLKTFKPLSKHVLRDAEHPREHPRSSAGGSERVIWVYTYRKSNLNFNNIMLRVQKSMEVVHTAVTTSLSSVNKIINDPWGCLVITGCIYSTRLGHVGPRLLRDLREYINWSLLIGHCFLII